MLLNKLILTLVSVLVLVSILVLVPALISGSVLILVLVLVLISGSVLGYIDINFNLTELILRRLQSVNLISTLILGYINFDALKLILRGLRAPP